MFIQYLLNLDLELNYKYMSTVINVQVCMYFSYNSLVNAVIQLF